MDCAKILKESHYESLYELSIELEGLGFNEYGCIKYKYNKKTGKEKLYLATGGWSENEYLISALQENIFWTLYWTKSERGGAFYFEHEHAPSAVKGE